MDDCLFCKIVAGEIPADIVHQTDDTLAFRDINPEAPTHILVIPRRHITSIDEMVAEDAGLAGRLTLVAAEIARAEGIAEAGYRTVINCNWEGGQRVFHVHLHLLGGRQMRWPPG